MSSIKLRRRETDSVEPYTYTYTYAYAYAYTYTYTNVPTHVSRESRFSTEGRVSSTVLLQHCDAKFPPPSTEHIFFYVGTYECIHAYVRTYL